MMVMVTPPPGISTPRPDVKVCGKSHRVVVADGDGGLSKTCESGWARVSHGRSARPDSVSASI